jgi:hypothetical protein
MYNHRAGVFRNSKPRNAKPSSTVVSRLFSWFSASRRWEKRRFGFKKMTVTGFIVIIYA